MPDFRVIDGDGPRSWKFERAVQTFERLTIELISNLVRQDQSPAPAVRLFLDFVSLAGECDEPPFDIIKQSLARINERMRQAAQREFVGEDLRVSEVGVRHVAAIIASDEFSRARTSKASTSLGNAIEQWLLAHERRSRENGWSYLRRLLADADRQDRAAKELDRWKKERSSKQPSSAVAASTKRGAPARKTSKKSPKPPPVPEDFSL